MRDRNAYIDIDYVFTYLISALILASVLRSTGSLGRSATENSIELVLQDLALRLAEKIETAIYLATKANSSELELNLSLSYPIELAGGGYEKVNYKIKLNNTTVTITTWQLELCTSIYNPGTCWVKVFGENYIRGYLLIREGTIGINKTIKIVYRYEEGLKYILVF
jgi:hypothetical protein